MFPFQISHPLAWKTLHNAHNSTVVARLWPQAESMRMAEE